jgi:GNAT superfamily N-acetyltransferase
MAVDAGESCHLRRAVPADAEAIARAHIASWRTTYAGLLPNDVIAKRTHWETRRDLWITRLSGERAVFVVEGDDGIAGFACASPMPERPQDYEPLPEYGAYLDALYLLADRQRRGFGRKLLAAVAGDLIAQRITSMALHVLSTSPARTFYERMGAAFVRDEPAYGEAYFSCAYGFSDLGVLAGAGSPA